MKLNNFIKFNADGTGGSSGEGTPPENPKIITPNPTPTPKKEENIHIEVDYSSIINKAIAEEAAKMRKEMETANKLEKIAQTIPEEKRQLFDSIREVSTPEKTLEYFEKNKNMFLPSNGDYSGAGQSPKNLDPNATLKENEIGKMYDISDSMIRLSTQEGAEEYDKKVIALIKFEKSKGSYSPEKFREILQKAAK